jgi:hypothetical protein
VPRWETVVDRSPLSFQFSGYRQHCAVLDLTLLGIPFHNNLCRCWPFLYSATSDSLYRSFENTFEASGKVKKRVYSFNPDRTVSAVPPDVVPIDCDERSDGWSVLSMPHPQEETIQFGPTWDDYASTLEPWELMLLQGVHLHQQSPFDIYQQLSEAPSATLVSDGGADHFQGSAGWVTAVGNCRIIRGQCPVPGFNPRYYCAEGYGMIGGLLFFLRHLCLYCGHLQLLPLH